MSSFLLGVVSSLHPCPLSTNIAVISLISSWSQNTLRRRTMLLLFVLSYVMTYVLLAVIICSSIFAVVDVAQFMDRIMSRLLGPILIIVGMFHCRLLCIHWSLFERYWQRFREQDASYASACFMAILLALAFCPATGALFFGILIPLIIHSGQVLSLPLVYGVGACLPLLCIAAAIAGSMRKVGSAQQTHNGYAEKFSLIAGIIIIITGLYVSLNDIFWS
ncbi:MAG: hypothetical protein HRU15_00700 [Planctomycetes bacterium]|nr:hypothetical protein [Planctomycetota bacterium]